MAKFRIQAGAELDLLTPKEFKDELGAAFKSWREEMARGGVFKQLQLSGTTDAAGALVMGGDLVEQGAGPGPGFMWSVRRLYVYGMADGDTVTVYINDANPRSAVCPITAALPYRGFHPNELVLKGSDRLVIAGSSLPIATEFVVTGAVKEVPEFMSWAM
jgi:hypothetical protein